MDQFTPDAMQAQLDRIEKKLDQLLAPVIADEESRRKMVDTFAWQSVGELE